MRNHILFLVFCLVCLCTLLAPSASARIIHVPADVPNLNLAIEQAGPGDIIELAVGRHKLAGRENFLKTGLTIRGPSDLAEGVVVEECACMCGDWRDSPVFILSAITSDPVLFKGITFRNFDLCCGYYPNNPVFAVSGGTLNFSNCRFENFYKTAAWYDNGASGTFSECVFVGGAGCPSAVYFDGERLDVVRCTFNDNRWMEDCGMLVGSIFRLQAGRTTFYDSMFADNGPLNHLVTVGPQAQLAAHNTCFSDNLSIYEGRVEGHATLDCCSIDPILWEIVGDGEMLVVDATTHELFGAKSMQVEQSSWTEVKNLFQ